MSQTATRNNPILKNSATDLLSRDSNGVALFLDKGSLEYSRQGGQSSQQAAQGISAAQSSRSKAAAKAAGKSFARTAYNFRCSLIKLYSGLTQFFSWFVFWPTYNLLFKVEYHGRENLRNLKGPLIMVSNHTRFYDSFLYRIIVGPFSRLLPMRFMAVIRFTDPFLNFVKNSVI